MKVSGLNILIYNVQYRMPGSPKEKTRTVSLSPIFLSVLSPDVMVMYHCPSQSTGVKNSSPPIKVANFALCMELSERQWVVIPTSNSAC